MPIAAMRTQRLTESRSGLVALQRVGDVRDVDAVAAVCKGADCVWHNAAAVGPFHPTELYAQVCHVPLTMCRPRGRYIAASSSCERVYLVG
jgi:hypothetical protein